MDLYLDTEFDGHGGHLISLAMSGSDDSSWYGIFDEQCGNEWVFHNVAPKLYAMPPSISGDHATLRASLREYLFSRANCVIFADWPADFEHLMRLMCGDNYDESFQVPCTMRLISTPYGWPRPHHPHNALSDAIALREWHSQFGLL